MVPPSVGLGSGGLGVISYRVQGLGAKMFIAGHVMF